MKHDHVGESLFQTRSIAGDGSTTVQTRGAVVTQPPLNRVSHAMQIAVEMLRTLSTSSVLIADRVAMTASLEIPVGGEVFRARL